MSEAAEEQLGGFMQELTAAEQRELVAMGQFQSFGEGEDLIRQGDTQHGLFLVLSGKLGVKAEGHMSKVDLSQIKPGESIGEMAVLDPMKASASVVGVEAGRVWVIGKDQFDRFLDHHPVAAVKILRYLARLLCQRIRKSSDKLIIEEEKHLPNRGFDDDY